MKHPLLAFLLGALAVSGITFVFILSVPAFSSIKLRLINQSLENDQALKNIQPLTDVQASVSDNGQILEDGEFSVGNETLGDEQSLASNSGFEKNESLSVFVNRLRRLQGLSTTAIARSDYIREVGELQVAFDDVVRHSRNITQSCMFVSTAATESYKEAIPMGYWQTINNKTGRYFIDDALPIANKISLEVEKACKEYL